MQAEKRKKIIGLYIYIYILYKSKKVREEIESGAQTGKFDSEPARLPLTLSKTENPSHFRKTRLHYNIRCFSRG